LKERRIAMRLRTKYCKTTRSIIAKKTFAGYKINPEKASKLRRDVWYKRRNLQDKDAEKVLSIVKPPSTDEFEAFHKIRLTKWEKFIKIAQDIGWWILCMHSCGLHFGIGGLRDVFYWTTDVRKTEYDFVQMCKTLESLECKIVLDYSHKNFLVSYFICFALPAVIYASIKLVKSIKTYLVEPMQNRTRLEELDRILRKYE
jgi:hypothetical protein